MKLVTLFSHGLGDASWVEEATLSSTAMDMLDDLAETCEHWLAKLVTVMTAVLVLQGPGQAGLRFAGAVPLQCMASCTIRHTE